MITSCHKALATIALIGSGMFSAVACSAGPGSDDGTTGAQGTDVQYLFVQTAHRVSLEGNTLTLHDVSPTTLYFSDRPERITGHGATEEMIGFWAPGEDGFGDDPPNATLSILGNDDREIREVVVVLKDPQLVDDQLSYTVEVLDGETPVSGGASSLFIDIIGRPLTPVSVAGTTRRVARRTAVRY